MPYFILYAAVSISVQVTVVPVSISDHTTSIGLPVVAVNTTPVGITVAVPVMSDIEPADAVEATPLTV